MSFPAYTQFGRDIRVGFARWKVYQALQPPFLSFDEPKDIKVEVVRRMARTSTRATIAALDWLESAGYIKVHARRPRRVVLTYALPDVPSIEPAPSGDHDISPAAPSRRVS